MNMRGEKIYEGKAKILYRGPQKGTLIQYFKDDATAFNGEKKGQIQGKGVINNRISEFLFQILQNASIPTHFIRRVNMREQLVYEVDIVPLEIVVRNYAAGSISKRLNIEEGTKLARPLIEFYLKNDALGDPLISEEHARVLSYASDDDLELIYTYTLRINDILTGLFAAVGIRLVDFKLEFGRRALEDGQSKIVLADEISPDSARLWDMESGKKLDKDRFRHDLGDVEASYVEVATRLGLLRDAETSAVIINLHDQGE